MILETIGSEEGKRIELSRYCSLAEFPARHIEYSSDVFKLYFQHPNKNNFKENSKISPKAGAVYLKTILVCPSLLWSTCVSIFWDAEKS
jgi:hypothetical protein